MKKIRILLDLDCVLADFITSASVAHGVNPLLLIERYWPPGLYGMTEVIGKALGEDGFTDTDFWRPINARRGFWRLLPILPWALDVFDLVTSATDDWWIVTSPSQCRECIPEKEEWLADVFGAEAARRMVPTRHKHLLAVAKDRDVVLIDDYDANVTAFREAGGSGILFPSHHNSAWQRKSDPLPSVRESLDQLLNR